MGDASDTAEVRYKIGEVCRLADVQPYVLRYWESEFASLAAPRGAQGPRTYSIRELKVVERIKQLLYDEGYTIAGAKKRLEGEIQSGALLGAAEPADKGPGETAPEPGGLAPAPSVETTPVKPPPDTRTSRRLTRKPPQQPALDSVVFEDVALPPAEATAPETDVPSRPATGPDGSSGTSVRTTPVNHHADLRIPRVLAELREIQALLTRDEP